MNATHRRLAGLLAGAAALGLPALAAAAALERTQPAGVRILFTDGTYGELGVVYTDPDLSGRGGNAPPVPASAFPAGRSPARRATCCATTGRSRARPRAT
jgi:hypothetical protein